MAKVRFHQFAWGLLAYNLLVVLSGAFVRASMSGDGCGNHWPNCNGEMLPDLGSAKTVIEYSHRMATGLLLPMTIALVVWAFRGFSKGHLARPAAAGVLTFTVAEALVGAGLVRFQLVAHDSSLLRAIVMPTHLVLTFLLLMSAALTAWWGAETPRPRFRGQGAMGWALVLAFVATLTLGVSGALMALGGTLFPVNDVVEGLRQDFAPGTHFLVGIRKYHPFIALTAGLYLLLVVALTMNLRPSPETQRFARWTIAVFLAQMGFGVLNLFFHAPIWMQLVHLLLADLFWISLVLMSACAVGEGVPHVELSQLGPAPDPALAGAPTWKDYLALTKPRVISLLLFTTLTAMFIAAGYEHRPLPGFLLCLVTGIGLYMSAGAANAINMVLERDLDLRMHRTASRPTVTAKIPPREALQFALILMVGSFLLLWAVANLLTAMLALAGLAFYVIIYTLLLKRRTWANIVIGGAAGAFPPLVGWAAVTGDLSPMAWVLFGIIFLWTPVHFWALALMIKEDYAKAGVPMLPVVHGERATVSQIAGYAVLTVGISVFPMALPGGAGSPAAVGGFYLAAAALLNIVLLQRSFSLYQKPDRPHAVSLFKYSMVYLALLFLAMAVDRGFSA